MNQRASQWAPVVAVGPIELLMWAFRQRIRVRVQGHSMMPTLNDGAHVLIRRTELAEVSDIVLCRHPFKRDVQIIKRIQATNKDGMRLVGDNPKSSTDSNSFGEVPWTHLVGIVTAQMA